MKQYVIQDITLPLFVTQLITTLTFVVNDQVLYMFGCHIDSSVGRPVHWSTVYITCISIVICEEQYSLKHKKNIIYLEFVMKVFVMFT